MGIKFNKLKNYLKEIKFSFQITEIWDEVKNYIRDELEAGEIIEILKTKSSACYIDLYKDVDCIPLDPLDEEFVVKTSTGQIFVVEEHHQGFKTETDCDKFSIYNEDRELLHTSSISVERKLTSN